MPAMRKEQVEEATNPPCVMGRRSKGPVVAVVLAYLNEYHEKHEGSPWPGLIVDEDFGEVGTALMDWYQETRGHPNQHGSLDFWTVRRMGDDGFDYYAAAAATAEKPELRRLTTFRWLDDTVPPLYWAPGIRACRDHAEAQQRLTRAWAGK